MSNEIGEFLKSLRKMRGLTLVQLEKISAVSNSYISQVENGHFKPSPDVLAKLSKALNANFFDLMVKAGYISTETKRDSMDKDFVTNMISQLSFDNKKAFISYFDLNYNKGVLFPSSRFEKQELKMKELKELGDIEELTESTITDFLITNFNILADMGDFLRLLRIHRGLTIDELADKLNVDRDEYVNSENNLDSFYALIHHYSEQIGAILNVGDFSKWYSEQKFSAPKDKVVVNDDESFGEKRSMKEETNKTEETFHIENIFSLKNLSINNRLLTNTEKEKALQILKLIFEES
ncbi:helix-turn-helix domain-containing protein [Psychrobacillus sp. MER TA 171]|uniref:helix-turn-helix domain-containing protein n=1 Tax=Psychrobacillus sp. MER TA 171 TaxID=2939577 RepID=UPI00203E1253|nr:helix-turn-helix domain-containing protein [Psychrobacillus sp. MER TA 171]MCM3359364.1 helix-turn-helix domain-containing protein [Psychrobacillus sp. MER TA 171]